MNLLKKSLFIILILIPIIGFSADIDKEVDLRPSISSVKYSWYISTWTIIDISWKNLDTCKKLKINNKLIDIKSNTKTKLQFIFWNNPYWWKIQLYCWKNNLINYYSFPFIKKFNFDKDFFENRKVILNWENFHRKWKIHTKWWSSKYIQASQTTSFVILPESFTNNELYYEYEWLKSNKIDLWLEFPSISYIKWDKWIKYNEEIEIYWNNIFDQKSTKIYLEDEEYKDFKINDWKILFRLWNIYWKKDLQIKSKWFLTKKVQIDILWEKPKIYFVTQKREKVTLDNWSTSTENYIQIKTDNLPSDWEWIKVYQNNKSIEYTLKNRNELRIYDYDLTKFQNYFHISVWWIDSNTKFINYKYKPLEILSYKIMDRIKDKKLVKVIMSKEREDDEYIYLDNKRLEIKNCYLNTCRVWIDNNILEWNLSIKDNLIWNINTIKYDLRADYQPFVEKIILKWILEWKTKIELIWKNLYFSKFLNTNLYSTDEDWEWKVDKSDLHVEWRIKRDYDSEKESTVSFENKWQKTNVHFFVKEWTRKWILWAPVIYWFKNINWLVNIKTWDTVKITWDWFKQWLKIHIWDRDIEPESISNNNREVTFIVPKDIETNEYKINVSTDKWVSISWRLINIFNTKNKEEIIITNTLLKKEPEIIENKSISTPLYTINIENKIDNIIIEKIWFKINSIDKPENIGTFQLKHNSKIIWISHVNKKGELIFLINYKLDLSQKEYKFDLIKKSVFTNDNKIEIILDSDNTNIKSQYKKIDMSNINYNSIKKEKLTISKQENYTCVNYEKENNNCKKETPDLVIPDTIEKDQISPQSPPNEIKTKEKIEPEVTPEIKVKTEIKEKPEPKIKVKTEIKENNPKFLYKIYIKSKSKLIKQKIISYWKLNKTEKWKMIIAIIDDTIKKRANNIDWQKNIYYKCDKLKIKMEGINNKTIINTLQIIDYLQARLWEIIYKNKSIEKSII